MPLRRIAILLIALLLLGGCAARAPEPAPPGPAATAPEPGKEPAQPPPQTPPKPATPADPEQAVRARAEQVLTALQQADRKLLATLVHPTKGVRFSPYSYARTEPGGDLVFTPSQLTALDPTAVLLWGAYDGSGHPIELTFPDYLKAFAYPKDYKKAPQVSYNQLIRTGNTKVNISEAYPDGVFMEYHFPGTQANAEIDWSSLRLVFEEEGGQWYLVGVLHDQWTI